MNLFPHAMDLMHCLTGHGKGSPFPAYVFVTMNVLIVIQYVRISLFWNSRDRSPMASAILAIFLVCAITYAVVPVTLFPSLVGYAKTFLLVVMCFNWIVCECFLTWAQTSGFDDTVPHQKLERLQEADESGMSNDEFREFYRTNIRGGQSEN